MVLELRPPEEPTLESLWHDAPTFFAYVLSFVYLGIYWNNHHHMLQLVDRITGGILWANLHLLFWLSLFPFSTAWMGENHIAPTPTAAYGFVLLMAAVAYYVLQRAILAHEGRDSILASALGHDWKGKLSPLLYLAGMAVAFITPWIATGLYAFAAILWLIPDRRIERELKKRE